MGTAGRYTCRLAATSCRLMPPLTERQLRPGCLLDACQGPAVQGPSTAAKKRDMELHAAQVHAGRATLELRNNRVWPQFAARASRLLSWLAVPAAACTDGAAATA